MAIATACANIALVKYWGKRDTRLNLPAAGSLSLTLASLRTSTSVDLIDGPDDRLVLDGKQEHGQRLQRVSRFLDLIRERTGKTQRAAIFSRNDFPTAGGLASSASAFAALAVAAAEAYGLAATPDQLSVLARRGSGSAARSLFGGFVRMFAGTRVDGTDALAKPLTGINFPLVAVIALATHREKEVGSTDGMEHTAATSPYHDAWLRQVDLDLAGAEAALKRDDFATLATIVEGNCLAMHANAMSARPGILYFRSSTLWAIERVRQLRKSGVPVFFTIDAGPHVVAFTRPERAEEVARALGAHPEIAGIIRSEIGGPARAIDVFPDVEEQP